MYIGWTAAIIAGGGMSSFAFLVGDIIDSFNTQKNTVKDMLDTTSLISMLFAVIGVIVWILSYISYTVLILFSEKTANKIRVTYFESILKQESAWFDTINSNELPVKLEKEVETI